MKPEGTRILLILALVAVGFWWWPWSRISAAVACWTLAAVYAILTSHRRWI